MEDPRAESRKALGHTAGQVYAILYVGDQLRRIADLLEETAPAVRNGAGEAVGRSIDVAASLRLDDGGARVTPAGLRPDDARGGKDGPT